MTNTMLRCGCSWVWQSWLQELDWVKRFFIYNNIPTVFLDVYRNMLTVIGSIDLPEKLQKTKAQFFFFSLAILGMIANIRNGSLSHYFVSPSEIPPVILDQSFSYLSSKANSLSSYGNPLTRGAPNFVDFQLYNLEEINIIISIDATQLEGIFPIFLSVLEHTHHPIHYYLMSSPINGTKLSNHWLKCFKLFQAAVGR